MTSRALFCSGFATLLTLGMASSVGGAVYTVDGREASGDDANPGTAEKPFRTIGKAAGLVQAGDVVRVHSGSYRETVTVEQSGTPERPIRFEAAPGAFVVITGADRLTEWTKEAGAGNIFSTPWPHRFIGWSKKMAHPDDEFHELIGRAEQVFVNGYPLHQVLRREQMGRGTFLADTEAKRLYVWSRDNRDATKLAVEASVRPVIWESKGDHIQVKGLRFRYAANPAQHGSVVIDGRSNILEDCLIEHANGLGLRVGTQRQGHHAIVRRCVIQYHGYTGVEGMGDDILFSECVVRANGTKGFNRGWGCGGSKFVLSRRMVIERCVFAENRGNGIWFDIGNEDCVVRNCLLADNEDAGLFAEISYGLHAHDNVVVGNGFAAGNGFDDPGGAWGANGGISLSSSPGCVVERNLVLGNCEGIQFREQLRTTPRIDKPGQPEEPVWNHDTTVRNNLVAYNHKAQIGGWFATKDGRHWPRAERDARRGANQAGVEADIAKEYLAKDMKGYPTDLSLETLRLTLRDNLYATEGQDLFLWGCRFWPQDSKVYADLDEVRGTLGLEQSSRREDVRFADAAARDLRLPENSPARQMGCYPQGNVPGVTLGAY